MRETVLYDRERRERRLQSGMKSREELPRNWEKCVSCMKFLNAASGADSSLVKGHKIRMPKENKQWYHISLASLASAPLNKRTNQITHGSSDVGWEKGKQDTNQLPRHVVAHRCATPSRRPSAASATIASLSTAASPTRLRSSFCPCQRLPSSQWRTVLVRKGPLRAQTIC